LGSFGITLSSFSSRIHSVTSFVDALSRASRDGTLREVGVAANYATAGWEITVGTRYDTDAADPAHCDASEVIE
jgi:hypothetical protein